MRCKDHLILLPTSGYTRPGTHIDIAIAFPRLFMIIQSNILEQFHQQRHTAGSELSSCGYVNILLPAQDAPKSPPFHFSIVAKEAFEMAGTCQMCENWVNLFV